MYDQYGYALAQKTLVEHLMIIIIRYFTFIVWGGGCEYIAKETIVKTVQYFNFIQKISNNAMKQRNEILCNFY